MEFFSIVLYRRAIVNRIAQNGGSGKIFYFFFGKVLTNPLNCVIICVIDNAKRKEGLMKGYENLSEEIIASCLRLKKSGLLLGTWGNVSVRLPDGNILITPSRVAYEEIDRKSVV